MLTYLLNFFFMCFLSSLMHTWMAILFGLFQFQFQFFTLKLQNSDKTQSRGFECDNGSQFPVRWLALLARFHWCHCIGCSRPAQGCPTFREQLSVRFLSSLPDLNAQYVLRHLLMLSDLYNQISTPTHKTEFLCRILRRCAGICMHACMLAQIMSNLSRLACR